MKLDRKLTNILSWLLLLLAQTLPSTAAEIPLDDARPYEEKYDEGWIDWRDGMIYGVGRASLEKNGGSKLKAMRAAKAIARGNIVKLAGKIQLDDNHSIDSWGGKQIATVLKAVIHDSEISGELHARNSEPYYQATRAAPIKGVSGLTRELLPHLKSANYLGLPAESSTATIAEDEDTDWLVLDARGLQGMDRIKPALFPKILSSGGAIIHQVSGVNPSALFKHGMVEYLVADPLNTSSVSDDPAGKIELDWLLTLMGVSPAEAEERRRRRREEFIVTKVEASQGLAKTNLVVSDQDARKLKETDASSGILKNCRVVVMVSGSVGGIEGKLRPQHRFALSGR